MVSIITRAGKGTPLTHDEMDTNLTNIKTAFESDRYAAAVMADNPVAYWRFNEEYGTTKIPDASGNGNYLTLSGSMMPMRGGLSASSDRGMSNNGAGIYGTPAATLWSVFPVGNNITMEGMAKLFSTTSYFPLFEFSSASSSGINRFGIRICDNGRFAPSLCFFSSAASGAYVQAPVNLNLYDWVHVAATYNGSTAVLYINGTPVAKVASATTLSTVARSYGGVLTDPYSDSVGTAIIDEIAFYNTCLSADRVALHARLAAGAFA